MTLALSIHQHLDLAFFGPDHHRLIPHAAHHVKRVPGPPPEGKLQDVLLNPALERLFESVLDLKKPIRRAQPADALMGPFVVVILGPKIDPLAGLIKAVKLGPLQKLV